MRGWSDALPPAFMRGVIPVFTLVSGGVRITGHKSINLSFRTSPQTGVGISNVQQAAKQLECHSEPVRTLVWESPPSSRPRPPNDGDCHTSDIGHWFAMTRNSLARNDREFDSVGILSVQQTAKQLECHSEPVRTLVWESPPSSRPRPPNDGDCHTSDIGHWFAMTWNSIVWESPSYSRPQNNYSVIPNQCAHWCGNLPRHRDRVLLTMEIATPVTSVTGSQ